MLSLGAGVQPTTVLLLAIDRVTPRFDAAIFADTGWEPRAVVQHPDRLEAIAAKAAIPILRVSAGDIRRDALDPTHRFVSMPLFVLGPNGERGMVRRQCTGEHEIKPIKKAVRSLLGYPHPQRVPKEVYAEQAIGISVDEFHRAKDADVAYLRNVFPLLTIGWTRADCTAYLTYRGLGDTPKSSCVGCPFHGNAQWRYIPDAEPDAWAEAVAFDQAIRHGDPCAHAPGDDPRAMYYLHPSRRPLAEADLGTRPDGADRDGGSPWSCRSGNPADGGATP